MPEHTITENLQRLQTAKTAIGNAITAKGGTVGANDGLEDFATDIATIPSGELSGNYAELTAREQTWRSGNSLFLNFDTLDIPEGVTALSNSLLTYGSYIRELTLPSSLTDVGNAITDNLGSNVDYPFIKFKSQSPPTAFTTTINSKQTILVPYNIDSIISYLTMRYYPDPTIYTYSAYSTVASGEQLPTCIYKNIQKAYYLTWYDSIEDLRLEAPPITVGNGAEVYATLTEATIHSNFQSSCTEVASGTTLTGTVNATVGDLVVATFAIRGNTYTFDSGWTLLGIGDNGALNQRTAMAYKIATSSSESLTVTQDTAGRMYINLVSITGASIGTFSGFTTQATGSSITLPKPQGLVIWGVSSAYWGTHTPYQLWDVSDKIDSAAIQLPNTTQPRCLTALDQSTDSTVTFR